MIYLVHKHTKEHRRYAEAEEWADAECRLVEADPDGWIEHDGKGCPLPGEHRVEVEYRDRCHDQGTADQWDICWYDDGIGKDITAYRPILDADTNPEPPAWDGEGERPPVGARCMRGHERVLILAYTDVGSPVGPAVVYQSLDDPGDIDWAVSSVFSPIRNVEDRAVEEMVRVLVDETGNEYSDVETASRILFRAGYRKVDA